MTAKFYLRTPYGNQYDIHENGEIERLDGHNQPSDSWVMLGILPINCSRLERMIPFTEIVPGQIDWTYKNGKPRFTVVDRDHGTIRTWGTGIQVFEATEDPRSFPRHGRPNLG